MTPFEIDILMHYFCHVDDHAVVSSNPPIWKATREAFVRDGLFEAAPVNQARSWALTPKGNAYCEALTQVPLPEAVWRVQWPREESE